MFNNARIKLTAWYLLIIMTISLSFSFFVYRNFIFEIKRGLRLKSYRVVPGYELFSPRIDPAPLFHLFIPQQNGQYEPDIIIFRDVQRRIILQLMIVNGGILVLSGLAGYFLAGKTLRPIEAMMEEQKRFVADASHELRTPLTAMKTEIEVALRDEKLSDTQAKKLLMSNLEEVDRMQRLSNYLLTLSRFQTPGTKLQIERISVRDIVNDAISRIQTSADEKEISIKTTIKETKLYGNAMSLTELLTILLDNAIKYSHHKGKILLEVKHHKTSTSITVADKGIGIRESELPYIFNRFYRADSSRSKTKIDGYGLGLSIAKRIAELHSGSIRVESTPEKGSTFTVTIPFASQQSLRLS